MMTLFSWESVSEHKKSLKEWNLLAVRRGKMRKRRRRRRREKENEEEEEENKEEEESAGYDGP